MSEVKVHIKEGVRFYWPDGRVCYEVPSADGKKQVSPDIRHAKKFGLLFGVTSIIKVRANYTLQNWKRGQDILSALTITRRPEEDDDSFIARVVEDAESHAKEAADRGKAIHAQVEHAFTSGVTPTDEAAKRVLASIEGYLDAITPGWKVTCEASFARPDLGYAGTPDIVAVFPDGKKVIFDLKTTDIAKFQKPYEAWRMQLAAYRQALDLPEAQLVQVVADRTTGECKFIPHEDTQRWETAFNHLLWHEMAVSGHNPRTT